MEPTMNEKYVLIQREVFEVCINTLKLIHPVDFDGMEKLVAVVATLLKEAAQGVQEGNGQPEDQEEQTEEKKKK